LSKSCHKVAKKLSKKCQKIVKVVQKYLKLQYQTEFQKKKKKKLVSCCSLAKLPAEEKIGKKTSVWKSFNQHSKKRANQRIKAMKVILNIDLNKYMLKNCC
jgi:hypothetical protein